MPPQSKPLTCGGCPLQTTGHGFASSVGPMGAAIAVVGEALGDREAEQSTPFVGPAGVYLNRAFALLGLPRESVRIGNVLHCQPPRDWLVRAPWEQAAIDHCRTHRVLNLYGHSPSVYLTLGAVSTRVVLSEILHVDYQGELNNWHSYVLGDKPPFVIPSFHPAHLLRGQQRLLGALCFAMRRSMEVASFGFVRQPVSLVVDPEPSWFANWASRLTPDSWLAVDVENPVTPGEEEENLPLGVGQITRINFSFNPDQGITVPWDPRYFSTITSLLTSPCPKVMWNERYDTDVLRRHNHVVNGVTLDAMWAWHFLQSSLPRGLGFASPFYSDLPPWKHLAESNVGHYAAMDAVQTIRCMFGIARDLKSQGQWDTFVRHCVQLDSRVLHPMEEVGLLLDPVRLTAFDKELEERSAQILSEIQSSVPPHLRPMTGGWKNLPDLPGAFPQTVRKVVTCCDECGAIDVTSRHRCDKQLPLKEIV